jgi:hypothetical protein
VSRKFESGECERLTDAIADGRFLEAPDFWRPHVRRCEPCRHRVEGLLLLRAKIRAAAAAAPMSALPSSDGAMRRAFVRFHAHRRKRRVALCVVAAVAAAVGAFALWRRKPPTGVEVAPIAYAEQLHRVVFPGGGRTEYHRLKDDFALRTEFVRALDHPSSLVRRSALVGLTSSGIDVDPDRLMRALSQWREDLEMPLALATLNADDRALRDALEARRTATIRSVIQAAHAQASRRGAQVPFAALVPWLSDPKEEIRLVVLSALELDSTYKPGREVWALLQHDSSPMVRAAAARCLMRRLGQAGTESVVDHLRESRDYSLEDHLLPSLTGVAAVASLSRARVASSETPVRTALWHALLLARSGERSPPEHLIASAFRDGSGDVLQVLASVSAEANWTTYRLPLQKAWSTLPMDVDRWSVGAALVPWDIQSGEVPRLRLALDVIAEDRYPAHRAQLRQLMTHNDSTIRARAQEVDSDWPLE